MVIKMTSTILGDSWSISEEGYKLITEDYTIKEKQKILNNALNTDLKEIGSPILSKILTKNSISQVVLQIQKIRNISAPKANENSQAAPRMLKLVLTDGDSYIQAIEVSPIQSLNRDKTAPGTKLLINSAKICSGYLLLNANNCTVLGGRVAILYEKWELTKSVQYHNRQNSSSDGPPAWVNFGSKPITKIEDNKQFKSLENKNQEAKENSKFDIQRQDAIAEATSGAVKKVFGGGNVKQSAPPQTQRKNDFYLNKERRGTSKKRGYNASATGDEEKPQKPSERVSLFDFLEDKLATNQNEISTNPAQVNNINHFYNKKPNYEKPKPRVEIHQSNDKQVEAVAVNMEKMSLSNSQFATRSLRQHLNLSANKKKSEEEGARPWKVGDECLAKYWEDGKFYNANITAVTDKTCVVKFRGYGNIEEILKRDCLPLAHHQNNTKKGPMEFRRSTKTYRRQ